MHARIIITKEWIVGLGTESPTPRYQIRRYFTFHTCIPGNHPSLSPLCVYPDRQKFKVRIVEATRVGVDKVCRGEVKQLESSRPYPH